MTTTDTMIYVRCLATGRTLRYTATEWAAFLAGAREGEFELPEPAALTAR